MFGRFRRNISRLSYDELGTNWHWKFVPELAKVIRPDVYVELGLSKCKLFNRMIPYANHLIGVDISPEAGKHMRQSPKVKFVNKTTDSYVSELRARHLAIDLLFIDADHSKQAVLRDFRNYFPFVVQHGLVLLHDGYPTENQVNPERCGTAYQAIEELTCETEEYDMMTLPISPGLTICRKRRSQLKWLEPRLENRNLMPYANLDSVGRNRVTESLEVAV